MPGVPPWTGGRPLKHSARWRAPSVPHTLAGLASKTAVPFLTGIRFKNSISLLLDRGSESSISPGYNYEI